MFFFTQSITNRHISSRSFSGITFLVFLFSIHSNFVSILAVLNHLTWNVWLFYLIRLCDKSYANNKRHLISHFLYHKNVTKTKCKRRSVINNKNGFRYHKANAQWLNDTWNNLMLLLWKFHFSNHGSVFQPWNIICVCARCFRISLTDIEAHDRCFCQQTDYDRFVKMIRCMHLILLPITRVCHLLGSNTKSRCNKVRSHKKSGFALKKI